MRRTEPFPDEEIEAIMIFHDPVHWAVDIQVATDVLLGGYPLGAGAPGRKQTPLYVSNCDFVFSGQYPLPRFAQGAFHRCLRILYEEYSGRQLSFTPYGKPHGITYRYTEDRLETFNRFHTPLSRIYGIGDNPKSDIRGANNAGKRWKSILVRSGLFKGDNDQEDPANYVYDTVVDAVNDILQKHSK